MSFYHHSGYFLQIRVVKAEKLTKLDYFLDMGDPWVSLKFHTLTQRTYTIKHLRKSECVWSAPDQYARFYVDGDSRDDILTIKLHNQNMKINQGKKNIIAKKDSWGSSTLKIPWGEISDAGGCKEIVIPLDPVGVLTLEFKILPQPLVQKVFWHRSLKMVMGDKESNTSSHADVATLMLFMGNDNGQGGTGGAVPQGNVVLNRAVEKADNPDDEDDSGAIDAALESIEVENINLNVSEKPNDMDEFRNSRGSVLRVDKDVLSFVESATTLTKDSIAPLLTDDVAAKLAAASAGGKKLVNLGRCPVTDQDLTVYKDEFSKMCTIIMAQDTASRGENMTDILFEEDVGDQSWLLAISEYDHETNVGQPYMDAGSIRDRSTGVVSPELMPTAVWSALLVAYASRHYKYIRGIVENSELKLTKLVKKKFNNPDKKVKMSQMNDFVKMYKIDMSKYVIENLEDYNTMNDFFIRDIKPELRPIADPEDCNICVSSGDCRLMTFSTIDDAMRMWVKGDLFSISSMLGPDAAEEAKLFEGGSMAIFRLAPQDYHKFHFCTSGKFTKTVDIPGWYHSVNPICVQHKDVNVFTENHRVVNFFDAADKGGKICHINVGANVVGSVVQHQKVGDEFKKGDEFGYFQYGGSTIILLFEKGKITFDADLVASSTKNIESYVKFGERIGVLH